MIKNIATLMLSLMLHLNAYGQVQKFFHQEDVIASFNKIHFWGIRDNTDGVFAKPIVDQTLDALTRHKQISFIDSLRATQNPFNQKASDRKKLISPLDGALWGEILKQGNYFKLRFSLFDREGQLFLDSEKVLEPNFSLQSLSQATHYLLGELFGKLPYQGWVVGKKDRLVTLNYGAKQGAKVGDQLDVVLVTNIKRHPLEDFVTEFEKQFIGKLLIQNIDGDISFGSIIQERYPGAVQIGSKIEAQRSVSYAPLIKAADSTLVDTRLDKNEERIIVGQDPKEWTEQFPQFGLIGVQVGFLQNTLNQNLDTRGAISGESTLLPSFNINGELWVTPKLALDLALRHSLGTLNIKESAQSSRLNYSDSLITLGASYRFSFESDPTRSYLYLGGRVFQFKNSIQETITHDLTSNLYSGLAATLGMRYAFPAQRMAISGHLELPLFTNSSEFPVTSGDLNSASRTRFGVGGEYFLSPVKSVNLDWVTEFFASSYSGAGSRPNTSSHSTQRATSLALGFSFYF